jgi:beta-glucanase (GH16 family)
MASSTLNLAGYKLTFDDEFNAFSNSPTGNGVTWSTSLNGWGDLRTLSSNGERQFYSDSSVGVNPFNLQNGALVITASPGSNSAGLPYNSGAISTINGFQQTYGYFEMRAQLPAGQGMWPAFWLCTKGQWPPELDPLEAFGATSPDGQGGVTQMHWGEISRDSALSAGSWVDVGTDITAGYHTYGVDWQPDRMTFYFDGQQIGQVNTPSDFSVPMYMIANVAVGGYWPGAPAGEMAQMKIDYIRAYSKSASAQAVNLETVSAPDGHDPGLRGASAANVAPSPGGGVTPTPSPSPGPGTIVVHVAEDAYQGHAQFTVSVDGTVVGGVQTATASHANGQWQDVAVSGIFANGTHNVVITFLNDAWGGSTATDRNLYINGLEFNGTHYDGAVSLLTTGATASFAVTGGSGSPVAWPGTPITSSSGQSIGYFESPLAQAGADWHLVGASDLSGRGKADLLWARATGEVASWQMDGGTFLGSTASAGRMGSEWHASGLGDFNGDGKGDIFWTRNTGQTAVWQMDGADPAAAALTNGQIGADWHIAGTGDFDGDHKADVLWVRDTNEVAVWTMNGTQVAGGGLAEGRVGTEWHTAGIGDFDGNGKADILWANGSGQVAVWSMDGAHMTDAALSGGRMGADWHAVGVGDLDGDGKADLVWQRDTGEVAFWLMNGTSVRNAAVFGTHTDPGFHLAEVRDLDGDGRQDLLWADSQNNTCVWTMKLAQADWAHV